MTTAGKPRAPRRVDSVLVLAVVFIGAILLRPVLVPLFRAQAVEMWATIFTAICVQALPFLVLGVLLSAALTVLVPDTFFTRALPKRQAAAVPVAGLAGVVLPGCECSSVPIAGALVGRGVPMAAALAFMLSAPAINPIVLVATAVAFPNAPVMVLARFAGSLIVSVVIGYAWAAFGKRDWVRMPRRPDIGGLSKPAAFAASMRHDFLQAGGFLVIGAAMAATLQVAVPKSVLGGIAGSPVISVLALGLLAVVLAICSEADAFVVASLTQFSMTAKLAFLVVGPAVDVKLMVLQAATFGRRVAIRVSTLTFVVALASAALVGWRLL